MVKEEGNRSRLVTIAVTNASLSSTTRSAKRTSAQSKRMAEEDKYRWEPALDPDSILVPGLNAAAPTVDQIEQIDQLITLKLQVSFVGAWLAKADLANLR
jgi:hypothetical protein